MKWIDPPEKNAAAISLEKFSWETADQFCANSVLKAEISTAALMSLNFLQVFEVSFAAQVANARSMDCGGRTSSVRDFTYNLSRVTN
jgi:hypothetical protein